MWGILEKVGAWVVSNIPTVGKIVKKTADIARQAASVVGSLLEGRVILDEQNKKAPSSRLRHSTERPDVMGSSDSKARKSELTDIQQRIDESKQKLTSVEEGNDLDHKKIKLQIDLLELIVSSSTFERFTNNINLHAANLQIHLQTIQNTAGLLSDVNRQRVAIKALIGTVNHLVNVVGVSDKVKKIEGLDIDIHPGAISIHKAYEAFETTKGLLLQELDSFANAADDQLGRVENIRKSARAVPDASSKMSRWLEKSVEPKLLDAKKMAIELKSELMVIPRLEASLRQELENIKQDEL